VKKTYVLTFTNYFDPLEGSITVNKSFHHHDGSSCNQSLNHPVIIELYDQKGELFRRAETQNESVTFTGLPLGVYTVREVRPVLETDPIINGHVWEHGVFVSEKKNGGAETALNVNAVTAGHTVTLEHDNDHYDLSIQNHYSEPSARIELHKAFSFSDLPEGATAAQHLQHFIEQYQAAHPGKTPGVSFSITNANNTEVGRLVLDAASSWVGVSDPLPVGTYTVAEISSELPGYEHTPYKATVTIDADDHGELLVSLLTNAYTRKTGSLTISKRFRQDPEEAKTGKKDYQALFEATNESIAVYIRHVGGSLDKKLYQEVFLNKDNHWTVELKNVPQGQYELAEEITKDDPDTAFLPHHALTALWSEADGTTDSSRTVGYDFITYDDWSSGDGSVSRLVTNTYKEHNHDITVQKAYTVGNEPHPLPKDYSVTIRITEVDNDNNPIPNEEYRQATLSGTPLTHTFALPKGRYLVEEFFTGEDPDHMFVSSAFSFSSNADKTHVSVTPLADMPGKAILEISELSDGEHEPAVLSITNDHRIKPAKITVSKSFTGDLTANLFDQTKFYVDIYDNNNTPDDTGDDGEPVEILTMQRVNDSSGEMDMERSFRAESGELPGGKTYRLVERIEYPQHMVAYECIPVWRRGDTVLSSDSTVYGVDIAPGETAELSLTNHYRLKTTGEKAITVQKYYEIEGMTEAETAAAAKDQTVTVYFRPVNKLAGMNDYYFLILQGTHPQQFSLPYGAYYVYESPANKIGHYTFAPESTIVSIRHENGDTSEYPSLFSGDFTSPSPEKVLNIEEDSVVEITIANFYTPDDGTIQLSKKFIGYAEGDLPQSVEITFTDTADETKAYPFTLTRAADGDPFLWRAKDAVKLPVGTYTVSERFTPDNADASRRVITAWEGLDENGQFVVSPGASLSLACSNTLESMLFAPVPFKKTIVQGGGIPCPPGTVLRFALDVRMPETVLLHAAAHSGGAVTSLTSAGSTDGVRHYLMELRMDNGAALEGYLEFIGFHDDLAQVELEIRETLYPFASVQEAAAAGWTYDESLFKASLAGTTRDGVTFSIHDVNGNAAASAAFKNTYTMNMPDGGLPQTGDGNSLPVWLAALSASALLLLRVRKKARRV